jgi:hypothetical protein
LANGSDISLSDILDAIKDGGGQMNPIWIVCDCPFSAKWLHEAVDYTTKNGPQNKLKEFKFLTLQATAKEESTTEWIAFSSTFLRNKDVTYRKDFGHFMFRSYYGQIAYS